MEQSEIYELAKSFGYDGSLSQSELLDWLEDNLIYVTHYVEGIGSDEWEFIFNIKYIPKSNRTDKKRGASFVEICSFKCYGVTYSGTYNTRDEAIWAGINFAIPLIEK